MYTFSKNLKLFSFALMILGALGLTYGFLTAPSTVEEAKALVADDHGAGHGAHGDAHYEEAAHDSSHDEHLLHQLQNKPWAALYVAALFFMMIALGTLAFYAIQRAAQAGWSPVLYRVM